MSRRSVSHLLLLVLTLVVGAWACRGSSGAKMNEIQKVSSGDLDIVLLSGGTAIYHGKDAFTIEFRSKSDGHLVDVGVVRARATMPMPGAPMFGSVEVARTDVPGRYAAQSDISMAGTWRIVIDWDGPSGSQSVNFSGRIQ